MDLQEIADEDQKERVGFFQFDQEKLLDLRDSDADRRRKVLELFRSGCINTAADYKNAALVFQHGETEDDYFRSFEWSKKGVALGDNSQKSMIAMSLDRYLVKSGKKQLFGTQAAREEKSGCWCLEQIEETFPETVRMEYTGKKIADQIQWVRGINSVKSCHTHQCERTLTTPPKGFIPGVW